MALVLVLAIVATVHLATMAIVADVLGVAVREIVLGWGPLICSYGRWKLKVLPLGGVVHVLDTRDGPTGLAMDAIDVARAVNLKPRYIQAIIPLSGPIALILLAICVRGPDAIWSVGTGFAQLLQATIDHDAAHQLLRRLQAVAQDGFLPLLGIVAAKLAAFNLLPLPSLNGGQVILSLLIGPTRSTPRWVQKAQVMGGALTVALALLWLAAIVSYT